jgi:hypothetical protein
MRLNKEMCVDETGRSLKPVQDNHMVSIIKLHAAIQRTAFVPSIAELDSSKKHLSPGRDLDSGYLPAP